MKSKGPFIKSHVTWGLHSCLGRIIKLAIHSAAIVNISAKCMWASSKYLKYLWNLAIWVGIIYFLVEINIAVNCTTQIIANSPRGMTYSQFLWCWMFCGKFHVTVLLLQCKKKNHYCNAKKIIDYTVFIHGIPVIHLTLMLCWRSFA